MSDFRRKPAVFIVASAPDNLAARVGRSPAVTGAGSLVYEMITGPHFLPEYLILRDIGRSDEIPTNDLLRRAAYEAAVGG